MRRKQADVNLHSFCFYSVNKADWSNPAQHLRLNSAALRLIKAPRWLIWDVWGGWRWWDASQTGERDDDGWNLHKDGHHNKSSRQAPRLATFPTASPWFSAFSSSVACSRPHNVSSSYGFCSPRADVGHTAAEATATGDKRQSREERQNSPAPSLWMRMLTSTCDDVCEQM